MNEDFKKYNELVSKYPNPSKAQREEIEKEVEKLVSNGYITQSMKVIYDLGIEKYRTIGIEDMAIETYDKDKSIKGILRGTYKYLPKDIISFIPYKKVVFNPFKPLSFKQSDLEFVNLYIPSKFMKYKAKQNEMIDFIDWNKYPNIKALFENVFKKEDRVNYFVNWLAYGFQTREKSGTAIISKGIQGTGKGVIFEQIIKYAIGERYVTPLDNEALKSRFNGELENKMFILANEIKADFREGNTIYERLKMYITDPTIRIEEKNIKARTIRNFFNIWFHSNNDVPLQIQGNDRRYTVFNTKSKKLTEVSKELGYAHISFYIEAIKQERDNFIFDIMRVKYDMQKATTHLNTEEKTLIYEASMSKIEVLSDKLKSNDMEYFRDIIEDFYSSSDYEEVKQDIYRDTNINSSDEFMQELINQVKGNYITNTIGRYLYKIFINESEKDRKIGLQLNKHLGKAFQKKITGKNIKVRKIDTDREEIIWSDNTNTQTSIDNLSCKDMGI